MDREERKGMVIGFTMLLGVHLLGYPIIYFESYIWEALLLLWILGFYLYFQRYFIHDGVEDTTRGLPQNGSPEGGDPVAADASACGPKPSADGQEEQVDESEADDDSK